MAGFNLNTVTLSGGLTFDPELRMLPSGTELCKLRMAFTESRKNGQTGEWEDHSGYVDVTLWGGMGKWAAKDLRKGSQIVVVGELRYREWEDKDSGKTRSQLDINAHSIFRDRGGSGSGSGGGGGGGSQADYSGGPPASGFQPRSDIPTDTGQQPAPKPAAPDDDIPF